MLELTSDALEPTTPALSHSQTGCIILLGSGYHALLTLLTSQVLTTHTDLVLANKLVPQDVLYLIHIKTQLVIAKKFRGDADWSQEDMMDLVEGARRVYVSFVSNN